MVPTSSLLVIMTAAVAQAPPPPVTSPEVRDGQVTFRLRAPGAREVRLDAGDIPGVPDGGRMAKGDDGVWAVTLAPPPGAYRYVFAVDGLRVVDPVNPAVSESNATVFSLVVVPGDPRFDTLDVPHGVLAEVIYPSAARGRPRRMHVYTPPGFPAGGPYPVLYLLHGASDSDDSWTSVGRANLILDNLIARGAAVPMIVVMPNGHPEPFEWGAPGGIDRQLSGFADEFARDIRPFVETHYPVRDDRGGRAVAGLSMGGAQTLDVLAASLGEFGWFGVFSSGIFGPPPGVTPTGPSWAERHRAVLGDEGLKSGIGLFYMAIGRDDFLLDVSRNTVAMLREHGFTVDYTETDGGHTWLCWRDYLADFAPRLFR